MEKAEEHVAFTFLPWIHSADQVNNYFTGTAGTKRKTGLNQPFKPPVTDDMINQVILITGEKCGHSVKIAYSSETCLFPAFST